MRLGLGWDRLAAQSQSVAQESPLTYATLGGEAQLRVTISSANPQNVQWRKHGQPIVGATTSTLVLRNVQPSDAGLYDVVVSSGSTTATSPAARVETRPAVYPQAMRVQSSFAPRFERAGGVGSVIAAPGGKFYLIGGFTSVDGTARTGVARMTGTGALDSSYVPPVIAAGAVRRGVLQPDGKLVICGTFGAVNGVPRRFITRLAVSGGPDPTFNPPVLIGIEANVIALQPDGKILVGGQFGASGSTTQNLVRLNPDGSLDAGFGWEAFSGWVTSIALQPDGRILVGARVFQLGAPMHTELTRLNADGSRDYSFIGRIWGDSVNALILQTDGKIVVGGRFAVPGGAASNIARLGTDGSIDTSFATGTGFSGEVFTLALQPDGQIIAGGIFDNYDGVSRHRIARLDVNGALDPEFAGSTGFVGAVTSVAVPEGGGVLAAGSFTSYGGTSLVGLARLDSDGRLRPGAPFVAVPGSVRAIVPYPGGKWIIGGVFTRVDGVARGGIALINADGSLDPAFANRGGFTNGMSSADVRAVVVQHDGRVIVGGSFTAYNGTSRNGIVRLNPDGSIDDSFRATGPLNNPPFERVETLALQADGRILAGGRFANFNGVPQENIVRLNADGTFDPSFAVGSGFSDLVSTLLVQTDGRILAGGAFTSYNGAPRGCIARLMPDGALDSSFEASADRWVGGVALAPAGKIVVSGVFTRFNRVYCPGMVRVNADGTLDPTYSNRTDLSITSSRAPLVQADGKIIHGGYYDSTSRPIGPARLFADGTLDYTLSVDDVVSTLFPETFHFAGNGNLLIGGERFEFADRAMSGLAMLEPVTYSPSGARLANLSVRAAGGTEAQTLSVGFVLAGSGTRNLLLRAIGPTLSQFGVPGAMPDPQLDLYEGALITRSNDDWGGTPALRESFSAAGAFPLDGFSRDAALTSSFEPGVYTAHVVALRGNGIALVEIYDRTASDGSARLANVSARNAVGSGEGFLTVGFVITGEGRVRLLVRGIGPTLSQFGVGGALADPRLALFDGTGALLQESDDWGGTTPLLVAFGRAGAFPLQTKSKDAALLVALPAGVYTAQLSGVSNATGVGLVELYELR